MLRFSKPKKLQFEDQIETFPFLFQEFVLARYVQSLGADTTHNILFFSMGFDLECAEGERFDPFEVSTFNYSKTSKKSRTKMTPHPSVHHSVGLDKYDLNNIKLVLDQVFGMKKHSRIQVIIVIWLFIAVPVCFTFFHYYSLSIADFLSSSLKIEAPDELNLPPGFLDNKWKIIGSNGFSILFSPELNIFLKFHNVSPQISSLNQVTSILRC